MASPEATPRRTAEEIRADQEHYEAVMQGYETVELYDKVHDIQRALNAVTEGLKTAPVIPNRPDKDADAVGAGTDTDLTDPDMDPTEPITGDPDDDAGSERHSHSWLMKKMAGGKNSGENNVDGERRKNRRFAFIATALAVGALAAGALGASKFGSNADKPVEKDKTEQTSTNTTQASAGAVGGLTAGESDHTATTTTEQESAGDDSSDIGTTHSESSVLRNAMEDAKNGTARTATSGATMTKAAQTKEFLKTYANRDSGRDAEGLIANMKFVNNAEINRQTLNDEIRRNPQLTAHLSAGVEADSPSFAEAARRVGKMNSLKDMFRNPDNIEAKADRAEAIIARLNEAKVSTEIHSGEYMTFISNLEGDLRVGKNTRYGDTWLVFTFEDGSVLKIRSCGQLVEKVLVQEQPTTTSYKAKVTGGSVKVVTHVNPKPKDNAKPPKEEKPPVKNCTTNPEMDECNTTEGKDASKNVKKGPNADNERVRATIPAPDTAIRKEGDPAVDPYEATKPDPAVRQDIIASEDDSRGAEAQTGATVATDTPATDAQATENANGPGNAQQVEDGQAPESQEEPANAGEVGGA